jgi:hypothetical protein
VEGVFRENADTLEGSVQHKRVDARPTALPAAGHTEKRIHARSVTLSSERLRVIAKLDLVEAEGERATTTWRHTGKFRLRWWIRLSARGVR